MRSFHEVIDHGTFRSPAGKLGTFPASGRYGCARIGSTKEAAFEAAALALTAVVTDPKSVAPTQEVSIVAEAPDDELLLVDWLNALVYEMATRKMLFSRFAVRF